MLVVWLFGIFTGACIIVPLFASILMNIIGLVEGIIYLTKTDEDFYQTYAIKKREWVLSRIIWTFIMQQNNSLQPKST